MKTESMTVGEVMAAKALCEHSINAAIQDFAESTGMHVDALDLLLTDITNMDDENSVYMYDAKLEVRL